MYKTASVKCWLTDRRLSTIRMQMLKKASKDCDAGEMVYNRIEKVLIPPEKVSFESKKVLIAPIPC